MSKTTSEEKNRFVGGFKPITGDMGWQTVGELKEALEHYDEDLKICIVQSTGPAETKTYEEDESKQEHTFVPFDFELENNTLYLPVYGGNILTFVLVSPNDEEEETTETTDEQ